jgi:NodT family efflux transporter outer membrane factor (OMF) lipoprotein
MAEQRSKYKMLHVTKPGGNKGAWPLTAVLLLLGGCMVGPKYQRPAAPVPTTYKEPQTQGFKESANWKPAQPNDAVLRGKWWEVYNDPALNALEEQVTISNQNLVSAEAQYRQAVDLVRVARSNLFPTLSIGASIVNTQSSANQFGTGGTGNAAISRIVQQRTLYTMPLSLSWTADVWGSIRRNINANVASAQATEALLENARLSFHSILAQNYFELHGVDGDMDLLERTAKSYEDYLQLTKDRFAAGVASDLDISQAETQLNTTRAQLVDLGVARAQFEHAIAVLIGKPPSGFSIPRQILSTPPPPIPVALPSALLERRPDIAAIERQMAAANEQIGIAMAAFYPTVSLSATTGLQSASAVDWFTWPSKYWSVGPTASETIFDAGRRRATVDQFRNAYEATVASYRQTVLTAFQQVEDNLAALRILANEAEQQAAAVSSSQRALDVSTEQYKAGMADYLTVITSQAVALNNERTAIDLLTRRLGSSVLLIEALGGGWNSSDLPSREQIIHRQ